MNKKIMAVLIMIAVVATTGTFAYWASNVEGTSEQAMGTLNIGSAESVDTTFDLSNTYNSGGLLVPLGQLVNSNEGAVEEINISYDVAWNEDEAVSQLDGTYTVGQINVSHVVAITVDGEVLDAKKYANIYDLITVTDSQDNPSELILDEAAKTFGFTVTMDEPADQAEYNLIANASISITFTYDIYDSQIQTTDNNAVWNEDQGTSQEFFFLG
jgi:predicted ribosomally synthesized peptide with SipW-like signal peptide